MPVDYSLYLVTDSTMLPEGTTVASQVEEALRGGVTLVQLREKNIDTRDFINRAKEVHGLCKQFGVPLIINDRVDVALAVGCEGVHVGQDDMPLAQVRAMLGKDKIVGVSVRDEAELREVIEDGTADYVGIGAVYGTATKKLKQGPIGCEGVRPLLDQLHGTGIKSVLIGGLNLSNAEATLRETRSLNHTDGLAVVSCIMASTSPRQVSSDLLALIKQNLSPYTQIYHNIHQISPMIHHITNNVVKNFSANVTLAVGASPIMSEATPEFVELARIPNAALVVNTGTITEDMKEAYTTAIKAYLSQGRPVVFDPVGCGATTYRREFNNELLKLLKGPNVVIKGNADEILALSGAATNQKGVDGSTHALEVITKAGLQLSEQQQCVVVASGKEDVVFYKGKHTIVKGGHPMMGNITGTGCSLGSVLAVFAGCGQDVQQTVVMALATYKEAGKKAALMSEGPGSFMINFLDQLHLVTTGDGNLETVGVVQ